MSMKAWLVSSGRPSGVQTPKPTGACANRLTRKPMGSATDFNFSCKRSKSCSDTAPALYGQSRRQLPARHEPQHHVLDHEVGRFLAAVLAQQVAGDAWPDAQPAP